VRFLRHRALVWIALLFPIASLHADDTTITLSDPAPSAAATGELKTMAVVAVASYETLISDISFLGSLAGKPELGQMVEGGLAFFTQGKGANALDKTKPWGIIVQTDGAAFLPVACLPVTKVDDLIAIATAYGSQVTDGDNGVKELLLPNQQTLFVKHDAGWAFVSNSSASLAQLPKDPQADLAKLVSEYDVAADISLKDVPEMYRQFAIAAMQAGMQQQLNKQADESDEQYELRQKMAETQMQQIVQMMNEIDSITFGWAVDAEEQRTFLDFSYLCKPGSKLAKQFAAYENTRTSFAGFYQPEAAATATIAMQSDPKLIEEDIAQFTTMMQTMRMQFNKAVDDNEEIDDAEAREAIKAAASDWFDAFEATMKAGHIDVGGALHLAPEGMTLVAAAVVKDSAKIESGLKKLESAAKKSPEFPGIKWNAVSHAGVNFHTLTVPIPEDQEAPRRLFGKEATLAVGIGPEAVYLAGGENGVDAAKKAIDASAAEPDKTVPPFEMAVSLRPIMEAAAAKVEENDQKAVIEAVAAMLRDEAKGRDHIRAVGNVIPNGLRYRFEAEEGVLRAFGKAASEAQRKALEAQQQ
jgi:hypothetical protein